MTQDPKGNGETPGSDRKPRERVNAWQAWTGFVAGLVCAPMIVFFGLEHYVEEVIESAWELTIVVSVLAVLLVVVVANRRRILDSLFGSAKGSIAAASDNVFEIVRKTAAGEVDEALLYSKRLANELLSLYAWIVFRGWVIGVILATIGIYAAVLGTVLLYRQNELIVAQNRQVEIQTSLLDSQRRATLMSELTSVLDRLTDADIPGVSVFLRSRLTSLSQRLTPYALLEHEGGEEVLTRVSVERGQLFGALIYASIDFDELNEFGATFEHADLRGGRLTGSAVGALLNEARFDGATLSGLRLPKAHMRKANFEGATLERVNLRNADLKGANLTGATIRESILIGTDLTNAILRDTALENVIVGRKDWLDRLSRDAGGVGLMDVGDYSVTATTYSYQDLADMVERDELTSYEQKEATYKLWKVSKRSQ